MKILNNNQSIVPIQEQRRDEKQNNLFAEVLDLENLKGTRQTFLNF